MPKAMSAPIVTTIGLSPLKNFGVALPFKLAGSKSCCSVTLALLALAASAAASGASAIVGGSRFLGALRSHLEKNCVDKQTRAPIVRVRANGVPGCAMAERSRGQEPPAHPALNGPRIR